MMVHVLPSLAVAGLAVAVGLVSGPQAIFRLVAWLLGGVVLVILGARSVHMLDEDEQLRVQRFTGTTVHNGPGLTMLNPVGYRSLLKVKAESLGTLDFVKVFDSVKGSDRVAKGPQLLFLGPHEKVIHKGQATSLSCTECLLVLDKLSGERSIVKGPCVWFPGPHDQSQRSNATSLSSTEYMTVEDQRSGEQSIVKGPCVWFPGPYTTAGPKQTAIALQEDEYVRLKDVASGQRWVQRGKGVVFLEPTWRVEGNTGGKNVGVRKAWALKVHEYIKLINVSTGSISVHRGDTMLFPGPDDEVLDGGVQEAVVVDSEHAALVRDGANGQLRLVTVPQLFAPGPSETIVEVRELIKLAEHEAMIIKDREGAFQYYYGSNSKRAPTQPRAFFLPPYAEIQQIWWSRGPRRERKDVSFQRFDCRPHFMKLEFNCRTSDNVELILEGVLFWELVDLPAMFRHTGDTSGDMGVHIRSQFILHVARVTLKGFMETLHDIAKTVLQEDTEFWTTRGLKVHSLEVTRYQCADKSTAAILEQIIQETTSRMNRLSQAESENEVNLFRTQGQVEQSKLTSDLLEIQRGQAQAEAHIAGLSEADRVATFLAGLSKEVPQLEDRIKMWQVLRKTEALSVVSKGSANLYFTPNDVDLSIEARGSPVVAPPVEA